MEAINHESRKHSLLSASGSDRWMSCTPSARKEEFIPNTESSYALEGTLAHELSELELNKYFNNLDANQYNLRLEEIENNEFYASDMPENVDVYVSYCIERVNYYKSICKHVEISIEEKVDLTAYIPEGFGSNDFVIIADGFIEVIDLKYGRGVPVSAVNNSQLKLYGLGSVYKHELSYQTSEVTLVIVQPRIDNISTFTLSVIDLQEWADTEVVTKAKMAFAGEGELNPGNWCKFCKFKPKCKAVHDQNMALVKEDFSDIDSLSEDEILNIFEKSTQITNWVNSINAYVMDKLLKKEEVKGYKLVKGRSTRKFNDTEKVKEILKEKYNSNDYLTEPKLLGITAIEKLVGKKQLPELLGNYIEKTEPKPSIALLEDRRLNFFDSAETDFL